MLEVAFGVAMFTLIVLALASLILVARAKLVATGDVEIVVNETKIVLAPVGETLLGALVLSGIRVPSGCGGIGTCGQCRVRLTRGGGPILPVETARITAREARQGVRLACQVKIKQPLGVRVPEEIFGVQEWDCRVRSSRNVGTLIKEIVLELPAGELLDFRAGSFVQVTSPPFRARFADFEIDPDFRQEWDHLDLWRHAATSSKPTARAYSMANYPDEKAIIILIVRIATPPPGAPEHVPPGVVSSYLFQLKTGDTVRVSGPFGHFFAPDTEKEMVFVGGGAGMAPMRAHIFDQLLRLKSERKITFWYGVRNRRELFYTEEFDRLQREHENFRWFVALSEPRPEDAWTGATGFIHDVLYEMYLEEHPAPEECEYYLCGPPLMIKAALRMLDRLGVERESIRFDDFGG